MTWIGNWYSIKNQKEPWNEVTYLWGDPVFAYGCCSFEHTFGPGWDVPCTVISITLKHQLALALLTGIKSTKSHAVGQAVHHLSIKQNTYMQSVITGAPVRRLYHYINSKDWTIHFLHKHNIVKTLTSNKQNHWFGNLHLKKQNI